MGTLGEVGIVSVVWSVIAAACFVPSFVINWRKVFRRKVAPALATSVQVSALMVEHAVVEP
jgi:hypothetical protein